MAREAAVEQAGLIAAEQRSVRANFIFLLGGDVEDEEEEAAQSTEISEGRLTNTARREIDRRHPRDDARRNRGWWLSIRPSRSRRHAPQ